MGTELDNSVDLPIVEDISSSSDLTAASHALEGAVTIPSGEGSTPQALFITAPDDLAASVAIPIIEDDEPLAALTPTSQAVESSAAIPIVEDDESPLALTPTTDAVESPVDIPIVEDDESYATLTSPPITHAAEESGAIPLVEDYEAGLKAVTDKVEASVDTSMMSVDRVSQTEISADDLQALPDTSVVAESRPSQAVLNSSVLRAQLGEDIFEIFCEEVTEISENLEALYPQWLDKPTDNDLLTEIRRAFHTLKGSGRMAGALALGDFAWAHEDMLNQVLSGQLPNDSRLAQQLQEAINALQARLTFFQHAPEKDAEVEALVANAEAVMQQQDPVPLLHFSCASTQHAQLGEATEPSSDDAWLADASSDTSADDELVFSVIEDDEASKVVTDEVVLDIVDEEVSVAEPLPDLQHDADNSASNAQAEPVIADITVDESVGEPVTELVEANETDGIIVGITEHDAETAETKADTETLDWAEVPTTALNEENTDPEMAALASVSNTLHVDSLDIESRIIWEAFWEELPEQLQALDNNLQQLRDNPHEPSIIRELEREFHTLKGGARMAQLNQLADISHESENFLNHLSSQQGGSEETIDTLQQAVDQLHTLAEAIQQQAQAASEVASPSAATSSEPKFVEEQESIATEAEPEESLTHSWAQLRSGQTEFSSLLERMLVEQAETLPEISALAIGQDREMPQAADAANAANNQRGSQETIRLAAGFIDGLIDRAVGLNVQQVRLSEHLSSMGMDIEELTRTVARLRQQIRALEVESEAQIHYGQSSRLQAANADFDPLEMDQYAEIQRISRSLAESFNDLVNLEADLASQVRKGEQLLQDDMSMTRQLRQDLLDTRLVALTMLVPRLRRLTRQTAAELDKQVVLEVDGEECELDRNLLQKMTAPLEHLLRNAISHGIEDAEQRRQAGKPANGTITLSVNRDDAEIVMRFQDDGRGLDKKRLYARALEQGLLEPGQVLPDAELYRLILQPGFTTAQSLSQIAGRGIGMDVVYSEIKALGGSLQINSEYGVGTEFVIRLPFTLVVNPVLLVEIQEQNYALPINGIQGVMRLSGKQIQDYVYDDEASVEFAGQQYHLKRLAELLGAPGVNQEYPEDEHFPVIFVQQSQHAVAWVIDRIRGRREVVLQPLGVMFKHCRLYSAATVASDGRVVLVPDMAELARQLIGEQEEAPIEQPQAAAEPEVERGPARVLVVDDSVTVRKVTEKFLSSYEYVVDAAKDGLEALERVDDFQPDVVLLDIEMPRMDGFELLGHLRREERWQQLPVIMISSRTAQKHREHANELGATGFLGKPYQNEILLNALQDVLQTGHVTNKTRVWEGA